MPVLLGFGTITFSKDLGLDSETLPIWSAALACRAVVRVGFEPPPLLFSGNTALSTKPAAQDFAGNGTHASPESLAVKVHFLRSWQRSMSTGANYLLSYRGDSEPMRVEQN